MQKLLLVYYYSENRAASRIWNVLPNIVFPPIWGEKMAEFWECACKLSWTLFSPAGFSPYMGREERRVQGLDYRHPGWWGWFCITWLAISNERPVGSKRVRRIVWAICCEIVRFRSLHDVSLTSVRNWLGCFRFNGGFWTNSGASFYFWLCKYSIVHAFIDLLFERSLKASSSSFKFSLCRPSTWFTVVILYTRNLE